MYTVSTRNNVFMIYIHHACRERYALNLERTHENRNTSQKNYVTILSSAPYGKIDLNTRITTAFNKHLWSTADHETGQVLFPNTELLKWNVGQYCDFDGKQVFSNDMLGEITCKLRWPIILVNNDIVEAVRNGATYHAKHQYTRPSSGKVCTYQGFMKDGEANGPGVRITVNGQLQDGTFTDGTLDGLSLIVFLNTRSFEEQKAAEKAAEEAGQPMPELQRFEGEYRRGLKHGSGYYCYPNGDRYSGYWA